MLDYKNIIIKRYTLNLSFKELAEEFGASKSGVNDFIRAFEKCDKLSYPLPEGITNYAISELVYGHVPGSNNRSSEYEQPDFEWVFRQMNERKNMTLTYLWNRYEREIKVLFEIMEKRSELCKSTIVCSQREPNSWASMILNDEVSANSILKRATKHYTVVIKPRE